MMNYVTQSIAAAVGLTLIARLSAGGGTLSLSEQGSSSGGGGGTMSGTIPPMD